MLPMVHVDGTSFADASGRRLTYAGISDFSLFSNYLHGINSDPIFEDRRAVLAETREQAEKTGDGQWMLPVLRVFFMADSFTHLHPQEWGEPFYSAARGWTDYAGEWGFYVCAEVFADAQVVMPDRSRQVEHWNRMMETFTGSTNVLLSKGNEAPKNGFNPLELPNPTNGLLWSQGSQLSDANPVQPFGDFTQYHGRRDGLKGYLSPTDLAWVEAGYPPAYLGAHRASILDEWLGAAEQDSHNRRSAEPKYFYFGGFTCSWAGAGGVFHSDNGVLSVPFEPVQRACALAWFMGQSKMDPAQRFTA